MNRCINLTVRSDFHNCSSAVVLQSELQRYMRPDIIDETFVLECRDCFFNLTVDTGDTAFQAAAPEGTISRNNRNDIPETSMILNVAEGSMCRVAKDVRHRCVIWFFFFLLVYAGWHTTFGCITVPC